MDSTTERPPSAVFYLVRCLSNRISASFRRSAVSAKPAPIRISASVALRLSGAMQLIQVPMIDGTSCMVPVSLEPNPSCMGSANPKSIYYLPPLVDLGLKANDPSKVQGGSKA